MDIIPVKIGKPIVGYQSFAEAIKGAANNPRQPRAKADGAVLAGRHFVGGKSSITRWALEFTGSRWLDILCENDQVIWHVVNSPPAFSAADAYILEWPSGVQSVIDAKKWFADRAGAEFWQLWVNESGFYVYLRKNLILCFHAIRHAETGNCVLAVCEDT